MKITTQRTLLWLACFGVALGMFGFMAVIVTTLKVRDFTRAEREIASDLAQELKEIRPPRDDEASSTGGARLASVFQSDFYYMGYKEPPRVEQPDRPVAGPQKAPALESLVEVVFLVAPVRSETAPGELDQVGKVVLKLKSLANDANTFTYQEGDLVGVGDGDRKDNEATLAKWTAQVLRIDTDGVAFKWSEDEVRVDISFRDRPSGIEVTGTDGLRMGSLEGGPGGGTGGGSAVALSGDLFVTVDKGNRTESELTQAGWDQLSDQGDQILDGVVFEDAKDRSGKDALKVKTIPAELAKYGIQSEDIIVRIDSQPVTSKESIAKYVKQTYRSRTQYNVTVLRNGRTRILQVKIPRDIKRQPQNFRPSTPRIGRR